LSASWEFFMSESPEQEVVFGLGGAWGFSTGDLTSPARAARAGAFTDSTPGLAASGFTELRVHGVSGSDGPIMLEHPAALQVAGDSTTMFYRRWTPAGAGNEGVPWKLEAYSWGGLTEKPLASAAWLLFAPFMLYNVAHFALPRPREYQVETLGQPTADLRPGEASSHAARGGAPDHAAAHHGPGDHPAQMLSRDPWHARAQAVLRLLAFSATVQFMSAIVAILVSTTAYQAADAHFPSWLSWYQSWPTGGRVALAMGGVAAVIAAMWMISVLTAHRYEARTSPARPRVNDQWPLTQTSFWKGRQLVARHRSLHAGGAAAATALIVSRPAAGMSAGRLAVMSASALVIALVLVTLCRPLADRHSVTMATVPGDGSPMKRDKSPGTRWCQLLLIAGTVEFAGALFTGGWPGRDQTRTGTLPGFTNICAFLLLGQVLLLMGLAVTVAILARRAPVPARAQEAAPFVAGQLTTLLAVLAVCLGGVFTAVLDLFATRLLGNPVPSGMQIKMTLAHPLQIPWPIYAWAAAPIGVAVGILIAGAWVFDTWRKNVGRFQEVTGDGAADRSDVARFYGDEFGNLDGTGYTGSRKKIARAWAVGLLVDQAAVVVFWAVAGMVAATAWAQIFAAQASRHTALNHYLSGIAATESIIGLILAGVLVTLLRVDFTNLAKRKTIGALWDVATFWPRATHPFAPPCYAERAVPELVDRLRILTGTVREAPDDPAWQQIKAHERDSGGSQAAGLTLPSGPVLLTGYSQGSILAPAAIAQLPHETLKRVALLTLACPARRLYGRAFPAYFGTESLRTLAGLLKVNVPAGPPGDDDLAPSGFTGGKWKNLVRPTDYIGSWVFARPVPDPDALRIQEGVDQPCWDPVAAAADIDPTPPPIHYHSGFWPDPRTTLLGEYLGSNSFPPPPKPPAAPGFPVVPEFPAAPES
jgi:hypothetical protein